MFVSSLSPILIAADSKRWNPAPRGLLPRMTGGGVEMVSCPRRLTSQDQNRQTGPGCQANWSPPADKTDVWGSIPCSIHPLFSLMFTSKSALLSHSFRERRNRTCRWLREDFQPARPSGSVLRHAQCTLCSETQQHVMFLLVKLIGHDAPANKAAGVHLDTQRNHPCRWTWRRRYLGWSSAGPATVTMSSGTKSV